jgi:hypothetical protein
LTFSAFPAITFAFTLPSEFLPLKFLSLVSPDNADLSFCLA